MERSRRHLENSGVGAVEAEDVWQACKWLVDDLGWPEDWERERAWVLEELEIEIFGPSERIAVNRADVVFRR